MCEASLQRAICLQLTIKHREAPHLCPKNLKKSYNERMIIGFLPIYDDSIKTDDRRAESVVPPAGSLLQLFGSQLTLSPSLYTAFSRLLGSVSGKTWIGTINSSL